jgi:hypothetical protein
MMEELDKGGGGANIHSLSIRVLMHLTFSEIISLTICLDQGIVVF